MFFEPEYIILFASTVSGVGSELRVELVAHEYVERVGFCWSQLARFRADLQSETDICSQAKQWSDKALLRKRAG